jgi:hypothetical protein
VTPIAHCVGNGAPRARDESAREPPLCEGVIRISSIPARFLSVESDTVTVEQDECVRIDRPYTCHGGWTRMTHGFSVKNLFAVIVAVVLGMLVSLADQPFS